MVRTPLTFRVTTTQRILLIASPLAIGFLASPLALLGVQTLVGGVPLDAAIADILEKQFAHGHNLFTLSLIGLIPFVVLAIRIRTYAANRTRRACFALWLSGLFGILAFMIPVHISVWYPLYGPGRMSSTGVIAFLFIPFYCIATLFIGLLIGHFVTRHQWFRAFPEGHCLGCGYDLQGNVTGVCPECGLGTVA